MKFEKLESIAEVIAGQSPPSSTYNKDGNGIPFFQGKADYGKIHPVVRNWCTKPTKISLPNDILISVRAPVGPVNINNIEACIGRGLSAIRVKENFSMQYVFSFLKANEIKIAKLGVGSTFTAITQKDLKNLIIPTPDYQTQLHIANILTKAESLIAQRKESIHLLDEYLKSVFLEMFGDPVRNEKGWEKHPFSELVAPDCPLTYGIVQPGNDFENGIPVIRPVDLTDTFITRKGLKLIDPKISEQFKRTLLKGEELLMCVRGTTGVVSIATKDVAGCNVTRGITPIWFSDNYNSFFAYSLFKTQALNNRIQELTYGATLKQINLGDLRKIELINPPLKLQTKFAQIVEKTEALKAQYQQSLQGFENLYGSLSQKAFKGELNLKDEGLLMAAEPELKYEKNK